MNGRAVVALLVVLGDDLPVGGQLVGVAVDDHQILGPVATHHVFEAGDVVGEFDVGTAGVDEQPAVPVDQAQLGEAELAGVEAVVESRCTAQTPVEPIRPGVVGAHDAAPLRGGAARE